MGQKKSKKTTARRRKPGVYRVFLSHATYDKWIARVLCEKIEALGATVFRDDRDIEGGNDIPDSIREAIRAADEVVVLLTPESIQRQWVLIEIGVAFGLQRRIVPLFCHIDPESTPDIIRDARGFGIDELDRYLVDVGKRMEKS